jgi:hypothetical protein
MGSQALIGTALARGGSRESRSAESLVLGLCGSCVPGPRLPIGNGQRSNPKSLIRVAVEATLQYYTTATFLKRVSVGTVIAGRPPGGEVSRFSCMQFLSVPGVYDYAAPLAGSRYRRRVCGLRVTGSASRFKVFAAPYPAH